jgi:hypothetical protein
MWSLSRETLPNKHASPIRKLSVTDFLTRYQNDSRNRLKQPFTDRTLIGNGLYEPVTNRFNICNGLNLTSITTNSCNCHLRSMRPPQQSYGRARVNHIDVQEAQNAQGVVLGEFLVSSVLGTVLFDSRASHSFISSSFFEQHIIPTVLLKLPIIT